MEQRVENAINVFLNAIKEGTLAKGSCSACAVGNLVAHGVGGKLTVDKYGSIWCDRINSTWSRLFVTVFGKQDIRLSRLDDVEIMCEIDSTEFTWKELASIEKAFECNTKIEANDYGEHTYSEILDDQIKGLEAVIKVMLSFSGDTKTDIKEVFTDKVVPAH